VAKLNIGQRMRDALPRLRAGVNGVEAPDMREECEEDWSADYAIVTEATPDPLWRHDMPYFDEHQWRMDFRKVLLELFSTKRKPAVYLGQSEKMKVTTAKPKKRVFRKWIAPGTVVVHRTMAEEIEVYRARA
jgi:hypothetical protein